ncbi:hypothetical protein [Arthrobacter sp. A2-55]|uniref:hypothetical protein n=1 Tax=Arthrobacter sp. A2-55 TaxID=2897337 RepID=UPI0021CDDC70|nr:hypothetical protein [Arthrobacter sp. A2-55]MCU6479176.1 hypothetical protein [Arthrobacter sp. A2-55]
MITASTQCASALAPRLSHLSAVAAVAAVVLLSGCSGAPVSPSSSAPGSTTATSAASGPATTAAASTDASAQPTVESAVNELVAGFPSTLIPLMKGAQVQASSLQRSTPLSVASLTATITAKPADVLAYYTKVYTGQKFTALPGDAVDGTPSKTFVRGAGQENVVVSVVQTGSTSTVTVGANVLPASLK